MKLWLEVCLPAFFLPTKKELGARPSSTFLD